MTKTTHVRPVAGVPLTKDDLAAIRLAESYTLHTHSYYEGSVLRLYTKSHQDPPVFSKRQQVLFPEQHLSDTRVRTIVVDGKAHGYGDYFSGVGGWQWPSWESADAQEGTPECFYSGYERDAWATIIRSLRVGTVLKVVWTADNNTEISRDAGLHLDHVRLVATTGSRVDTWNVGWACSRDNSARMIRRSGPV